MKKKSNKLSEARIDEIVIKDADDPSKWEDAIKVNAPKQ